MSDTETDPFGNECKALRADLRELGKKVWLMHEAPIFLVVETYHGQHDEMHSNLTLSYRHLEDAIMRLGKAIQAYNGGASIYDR